MPTRKIADFHGPKICRDPDHDPASMVVREPGVYLHECPACGRKMTFVVPPKPMLDARPAYRPMGDFWHGASNPLPPDSAIEMQWRSALRNADQHPTMKPIRFDSCVIQPGSSPADIIAKLKGFCDRNGIR